MHVQDSELEARELKAIRRIKMTSIGELARGIAHDMNTPIGTLSLLVELLEDHFNEGPSNSVEGLEFCQKIRNTVLSFGKIVNYLKKFSRDGKEEPYTLIKPMDIAENTKQLFFHACIRLQIEFILQNDLKPDCILECQQMEISDVLVNLVRNSIEAIKNLPEKWIQVHLSETQEAVIFRVTDSGKGIEPQYRNSLFSSHFTTKSPELGGGLGLPICKSIVISHGGRIELDASHPNTSFLVELKKNQPIHTKD